MKYDWGLTWILYNKLHWLDVIKAALRAPHRVVNFVNYSRDSIELILAQTKKTSPGSDNVPYWVYHDCAHELSDVFTMIVNMSVAFGVVPSAWRTAVIPPVPKCTPVNEVSDLRPISVTPILSCIVERLIVRDHIFPAIPTNEILD